MDFVRVCMRHVAWKTKEDQKDGKEPIGIANISFQTGLSDEEALFDALCSIFIFSKIYDARSRKVLGCVAKDFDGKPIIIEAIAIKKE